MDWKSVAGVIASIVLVLGYVPYFKEIFSRTTKPHLYTWIIWMITQGTALYGLWIGGGGWAALALSASTFLVFSVVILCFWYGTKDITRSDTVVLVLALLAVVVWLLFRVPLLSVILVSLIDGLGYIPTYRKTWKDPTSESLGFWLMMALGMALTIASTREYNFLTLTYVTVLCVSNVAVWGISLRRRR